MSLRKVMLLTLLATVASAPLVFAVQRRTVSITRVGTKNLSQVASRVSVSNSRLANRRPFAKPELRKPILPVSAATVRPNTTALMAPNLPITGNVAGFLGFDALNSTDSAVAGAGIGEPPDQGLASSGTQELEAINTIMSVYSPTGKRLLKPVSLYDFFSIPLNDSAGNEFILSDPKVYFDSATNRWFITILRFVVNPQTGQLVPHTGSTVMLGVSTARDAQSDYNQYEIDVSDAEHTNCPCLGDQPLMGANQDGLFLEVNEFSTTTGRFVTAQVIALQKRALANGSTTVNAVGFDDLVQDGGPGFSVQPAIAATGQSTAANNGTEYFLSSLDFNGTVDNRLTIWAMTNTKSLANASPNVSFKHKVFTVTAYAQPPSATQKSGPRPLGSSLGEPLERLETNDDRLQQVYYANGKLFSALNTAILVSGGGSPKAGIAYFILTPTASSTSVGASVVKQGYITVAGQHVMFPSFAVSNGGSGVIGFSMSGPSYFPSAAYVTVSGTTIGGSVHLARAGKVPEDGFSGYRAFGGDGVARWGDYSAAFISPGGQVWFATEYIPDPNVRPRTQFTNWGTFISRVK
jgi:hypothetical protein